MREVRNTQSVLAGKPEGKRPLGRFGVAGKIILESILMKECVKL
jgi:hypothetical protein